MHQAGAPSTWNAQKGVVTLTEARRIEANFVAWLAQAATLAALSIPPWR
jgi:hypothetical protein